MTNVLGMSFAEAEEIYIHAVHALPFLSIPIYLIFAVLGKGLTRRAFYFSLSTPGLFALAMVVWEALIAELRPYLLHPASVTLAGGFLFEPGYLIFPLVWTVQIVLMIKGNWGELRWSTLAACVGLLFLHAWDAIGVNVAHYA